MKPSKDRTAPGTLPIARRRSRRARILALAAVASAALIMGACGSPGTTSGSGQAGAPGAAPSAMTAKIAVPAHAFGAIPLLAAFALHTDTANSLHMEEVSFAGSSSNVVAAVVSGATQFGSVGGATAVSAIKEGAPVVIVGGMSGGLYELAIAPDVLKKSGVTRDAPIQSRVDALRGLTIGTSAAGSTNNTILGGLLKANGIDPEKDVNIAPTDPSALVAGLKSGLYDAGFWSTGVMEPAISAGSADVLISVPQGDFPEYKNFLTGVVITSKATLKSDPALVAAFYATLKGAGEKIQSDPNGVANTLHGAYFNTQDRKVFDLAWASSLPALMTDPIVTKEIFDAHLKVQQDLLGGDLSTLKFEDVVYSPANALHGSKS